MRLLYNLGVHLYGLLIRLASLKNTKAQKWLKGRKNWQLKVAQVGHEHPQSLWVHAASLGEIEQGLPIIQEWKKQHPSQKIVVSFFSPSGYENFQYQDQVDEVLYLPLDTPQNAFKFVKLLKPKIALFIKYEIWVNYFEALANSQIPMVLAPAVFRPSQIYFSSWSGSFFIRSLQQIKAILVQDISSLEVLKKKGLSNTEICGDTRFDRVLQLTHSPFDTSRLEEFINQQFCLVAGSSWPKEEAMLEELLKSPGNLKVIIAPHLVDQDNIERLSQNFDSFGVSLYTDEHWHKQNKVLIINTMGDLNKIYRVGSMALVGGGFGESVHSTVEPLCYGLPVCFGPNHKRFIEPSEMLKRKIGFEIKSSNDLKTLIASLQDKSKLQEIREKIDGYVSEKSGATQIILDKLKTFYP